MQSGGELHLVAQAPSGTRINVSAPTVADLELLAEALHDARPTWQLCIDDRQVVFSREGKIVDLVQTGSPLARAV
jgi:hypothetical protein